MVIQVFADIRQNYYPDTLYAQNYIILKITNSRIILLYQVIKINIKHSNMLVQDTTSVEVESYSSANIPV